MMPLGFYWASLELLGLLGLRGPMTMLLGFPGHVRSRRSQVPDAPSGAPAAGSLPGSVGRS